MYKVEVLLNVFDSNTGIWPDENKKSIKKMLWVRKDDGEVLFQSHETSDGLPQYVDIKEDKKQNIWFMNLIFNAEEIEDY